MKPSRNIFPLMVLLAVVLCATVYRSVRTVAEPSDTENAAARPAPGRADAPRIPRITEIRPEIALPEHRSSDRQGSDFAWMDAQNPASKDPRADPEARAEQQRKWQEYMAGVDAAFRKEATDPRWSSTTSTMVRSVLSASSELGPLAHGLECRSRTCRVEIADDGSGVLGKLIPKFAQQVGQELPRMVAERVEDPHGGTMMALYMSRLDDSQAMAK